MSSVISFSQTGSLIKAKELSLTFNLPIVGKRREGFTPFLSEVKFKLDLNSSYLSIFYDDNRYAMHAFLILHS